MYLTSCFACDLRRLLRRADEQRAVEQHADAGQRDHGGVVGHELFRAAGRLDGQQLEPAYLISATFWPCGSCLPSRYRASRAHRFCVQGESAIFHAGRKGGRHSDGLLGRLDPDVLHHDDAAHGRRCRATSWVFRPSPTARCCLVWDPIASGWVGYTASRTGRLLASAMRHRSIDSENSSCATATAERNSRN